MRLFPMPRSEAPAVFSAEPATSTPAPTAGAPLLRDPSEVPGALPGWLNHRLAALAGVVLAVLTAVGAAAFLNLERDAQLAQEHRSARLMARVLEDHATRTLVSAELVLLTLSEATGPLGDAAQITATLRHALPGQPALRSVSMLAADGRVLASSNADNEHLRLDASVLPPAALAQDHWLGPAMAGRDLGDLAVRAGARAAAAPRSPAELILLVRRLPRGPAPGAGAAAARYLVAALNPDAIANHFRMATQDSGYAGMLFDVRGRALVAHPAASGAALAMPVLGGHEIFAQQLPQTEHGSLVATGALDGSPALVAYRASRVTPVVAWVEKPMAQVLAAWHALLGTTLVAVFTAWAVIAVLTAAAWRSLRARWLLTRQLARADARAVARERELRRLVDGVHEVLLRTDVDGRLSFANQRLLELTGRLEEDILGQPLWTLVQEADRERVRGLVTRRADSAERVVATLVSDGPEAPSVELSMAWHAPGPDEPGGYMGFAVDVSERERVRRELKRQLEFSRTVLQVLPVPVFVKDRHGRCLAVNKAWEDFTGLSSAQVVGRALDTTPATPSLVQVHDANDAALLQGAQASHRAELQLLRADGQVRDVVVSKIALRQRDGRPAGIVGSIHDVTDFLQAQRAMAHARDAAEASDRVKTGFIANVSHELRTPLQSILGFSELALRRAMPPERVRGVLEDIHRSGDRMLTLVNEVLDISKFDSAAVDLVLQGGDPAALAAEVAHELGPIAQQRDIRIEVGPAAEPQPLLAMLNPFRFSQVVRNVLANAVRFSEAGGTVRLEVAAEAGAPDGPDGVVVRVIDQGPGVPDTELEAIFEPFTQSTRTGDGSGGTGLGLTIARSIMKAHGGRIWAANRAEGGAVFSLWLPLASEEALSRPVPLDEAQHGAEEAPWPAAAVAGDAAREPAAA